MEKEPTIHRVRDFCHCRSSSCPPSMDLKRVINPDESASGHYVSIGIYQLDQNSQDVRWELRDPILLKERTPWLGAIRRAWLVMKAPFRNSPKLESDPAHTGSSPKWASDTWSFPNCHSPDHCTLGLISTPSDSYAPIGIFLLPSQHSTDGGMDPLIPFDGSKSRVSTSLRKFPSPPHCSAETPVSPIFSPSNWLIGHMLSCPHISMGIFTLGTWITENKLEATWKGNISWSLFGHFLLHSPPNHLSHL